MRRAAGGGLQLGYLRYCRRRNRLLYFMRQKSKSRIWTINGSYGMIDMIGRVDEGNRTGEINRTDTYGSNTDTRYDKAGGARRRKWSE